MKSAEINYKQLAFIMSAAARMSQPSTPALQPNYMKVFIQRDYSEGSGVKFQTRFPPELESRVSIYFTMLQSSVQ